MVGKTISHYKILGELGRGGMGIVYEAEDLRLDRKVAVKVLPSTALSSEDDRARFFREAKAAAQLQHPNIAVVFEVDEAIPEGAESDNRRPFLVMEFIEGETLDEKVKAGPLKLKDAVHIAIEIASGLQAAHEKNIVHRDIKSSNVMLTSKGVAKILDFGLAKTAASTKLTQQGSTVGTIGYMSPEQARGDEVDARTDIWSLGVVLYEMISGISPFPGEYEQAVLYEILNQDPEPLTALRTGVAFELERIVNKLLSKKVDFRYQTASDLLADLKAVEVGGSGHSRQTKETAVESPEQVASKEMTFRTMPVWGWGLVAFSLVLGTLVAKFTSPAPASEASPVIHATLDVIEGDEPPFALAVSSSSQLLAYSDHEQVSVRNLKTDEEWNIPDSGQILRVLFSEDENWLFMERQGAILRAPVRGGAPFEIASVAATYPTVNLAPDNFIVYESGGSIFKKSLSGGEAIPVLVPDSSTERFDDPTLAPDGKNLIVVRYPLNESSLLELYDYESGELRGNLNTSGFKSFYLDSGHFLFQSGAQLFAVTIDLNKATLTGAPVPIMQYINHRAISITPQGHLFYAQQNEGGVVGFANRRLHKVNWDQSEITLPPERGIYNDFRLSPSGTHAAIEATIGSEDLWVVDIYSGVRSRLTFGNSGEEPAWNHSGDSLYFVNKRPAGGMSSLNIKATDGSGDEREVFLMTDGKIEYPHPNRDGSKIVFSARGSSVSVNNDIWELDTRSGRARPVIGGQGDQKMPSYSPDGQYIVYQGPSDEGEVRVWMQSADFDDRRWDISRSYGIDPRWAPDGHSIYFKAGRELKKVDLEYSGSSISLSNPEVVVETVDDLLAYDVFPDGSGILTIKSGAVLTTEVQKNSDGLIHVIFNWTDYLKEIVPVPE